MAKERPILFNAAMVRALLDGSKTQTRRPVKMTDAGRAAAEGKSPIVYRREDGAAQHAFVGSDGLHAWIGQNTNAAEVGDLLWVRETWRETRDDHARKCIEYRADGAKRLYLKDGAVMAADPRPSKWRAAMPRELSRLTLEVTGVRVERVQDITEADAVAEGVASTAINGDVVGAFAMLWQSTYGAAEWERNDWVWVVSFQSVEGGSR